MNVLVAIVSAALLAAPASAMYTSAPLPPASDRPLTPVIIDPGHGGDDLGAVVKGIQEKDIALAVGLKLRDKIKGDMPVMLTRDSDHYVTLNDRIVNSVDWNGAVFVSIHLNKVRNTRESGAVVYSYGADRHRGRRRHLHPLVPPMPAPPRIDAKESAFLAAAMVKAMRGDGYRVEDKKSDYYVLKNPAQPSILIEIGYLSNPAEAARLNDPAYQDKLVGTIAKAIESYAADRSLRAETKTALVAAPSAHL